MKILSTECTTFIRDVRIMLCDADTRLLTDDQPGDVGPYTP